VRTSDLIVSNGGMNFDKLRRIGKEVVVAKFEVQSQKFPEETEEYHEKQQLIF
jgi:hypothetical protein